jgi:hypothetical protein
MERQTIQKNSVPGKKKPGNKQVQGCVLNAKETPEQMIRSLQGIFCKGRYSSWVFSQN